MTNKMPKNPRGGFAKVEDFLRELFGNDYVIHFVRHLKDDKKYLHIDDSEYRVVIKDYKKLQSRYDELIGAKKGGDE